MHHMTTESEALDYLVANGYSANLEVREDGRVGVAGRGEPTWNPAEVIIEEQCRFEGESNPDDEALIVGVILPDGSRGVLTMPYGPDISGPQGDAVRSMSTDRS